MYTHREVLSVLLLCGTGVALASPVTYHVSANTSSIMGKIGSVDFNFNPGPLATQTASLQVLNFATDGSLAGASSLAGDASGTLPGSLTFDNAAAFNDYFQELTYGSSLSFDVSLFGPALSSPDGTSTSGSSFAFSIFSNPAGTVPVLTTDTTDGFAYVVNVNLDGTTTAINYIPQSVSPTPEPSSLLLLVTGMAFLLGLWRINRPFRERTLALQP